jgi:hypothetical protein
MPPPPNAGLVAVDIPLRPDEIIAAWRPDTGRLALAVRETLQSRQRVAARIRAVGLGIEATITGRIASVRRSADGLRIELEPDDTRLLALKRLVAIAGGKSVAYQLRAPRLLVTLPAVVYDHRGPTYMTTFSVSGNGCGLAWSGPMPEVGVPMEIKLGAGIRVASFCGEVCWTAPPSARAPTVGVHFAAGERSAWERIFAELKHSGAPPA